MVLCAYYDILVVTPCSLTGFTNITEEHAVTLFRITLPARVGIAVGTATRYRQDGAGIECQWRRHFTHPSRLALGPTQLPS